MKLSDRILSIEGSKTARFIPLVEKLRREGRQVISLAIGEPTVDTPTAVIDATKRALDRQETRYSDMAGLMHLRTALANRFENCEPENIVVFNGSKQALYAIFQTICDPGDQVVIPVPCWVSFAEQVKLAGGKPVLVATELGLSNPDNPGPAAVRASGRLCYASAGRAVAALDALWRHAMRQI